MPIYYKDPIRGWQYTGTPSGTDQNNSFYYNDNGTWRNVKSAWIKVNGKWQQVYERKNSTVGLPKVFVNKKHLKKFFLVFLFQHSLIFH